MSAPSPSNLVHALERPDRSLLTQFVLTAILSGPFFPILILPLLFKYQTLRYRFDEEGIAMSWGLLWRQEVHLTYARIQDIHLSRGLIERWLGIATIQIQTASGSAGAEMSLLGLREYDLVRDYLYSKMRGARGLEAGELVEPPSSREDPPLALLTEIRDELRAIRARLEEGRA